MAGPRIPTSRFGRVGSQAHQEIFAANLRGMAEAVSRQDFSNVEEIQAQLTAMVFEQFEILISSIYHQGTIVQVPFLAQPTPRLIRPSELRNYVFVQNQDAGNQIVLSIGQDPISATATPTNGLIIGANLGYYEPSVVPVGDLWVSATGADTPGMLLISLPSWQKTAPV